jgi:hypothetical protein
VEQDGMQGCRILLFNTADPHSFLLVWRSHFPNPSEAWS